MSVQFYIKDENGIFLSIDGKVKYTCLEGQKLYNFLKTKDGRNRCFHVEIDEDGNKIGIEATPEFIKAEESEKNHASYLERQKAKFGLEIISSNGNVRNNETDLQLIETIADVTVDVESEVIKAIEKQSLRKALERMTADEYDLLYYLFLSEKPLTERQYGAARGLPQKTVNCRKQAIFSKLKKYL